MFIALVQRWTDYTSLDANMLLLKYKTLNIFSQMGFHFDRLESHVREDTTVRSDYSGPLISYRNHWATSFHLAAGSCQARLGHVKLRPPFMIM